MSSDSAACLRVIRAYRALRRAGGIVARRADEAWAASLTGLAFPGGSGEASERLRAAGWSLGCGTLRGPDGLTWFVWLCKGGRTIRAEGPTRAAAWAEALRQAELGHGPGAE